MRKRLSELCKNEEGQVIVEYALMLALAVFIVGLLATGFRNSLIRLWEMIGREVSAACPKCPPDPGVRIR